MKHKAIFFDFDGTLIDSYKTTLAAYAICAPRYGFPLLDTELLTFLRSSTTGKIIARMGLKTLRFPFLVRSVRSELRKKMREMDLHTGIDKVIEQLAKDYEVYIVSSNSNKFITDYFNQERLIHVRKHIKEIYCYTSAFGKARLLKRVLKQTNLTAKQVIYVGDEVRDIEACRKIAMPIISVSWGFATRHGLEALNHNLTDTPDELLTLIKSIDESI